MSASDKLNQVFKTNWNNQALISDQASYTYQEIYNRASGIAGWLVDQGCVQEDSIALQLPNGPPLAMAYLACILGGFRFIPINPELSKTDRDHIIEITKPKIVLEDSAFIDSIEPANSLHPEFNFSDGKTIAVFFTSGTTGKPKGVCHSLDALVYNVICFNETMGLDGNLRQYHVLPMTYMAGFLNTLLSPWLAGGVVLLGPLFSPAEALSFWKRPLQWQANAIWLTPTLAAILVRLNRDKTTAQAVCSQMKSIFCGTAPLPETVRNSFLKEFHHPLQESYGMSEVLLVSAQTKEAATKEIDVGKLLPGVEISMRKVEGGKDEELIIHSSWVMKSYLDSSGEHSPLITNNGMPSGDFGTVTNGTLLITGRLKDLIIKGGKNVSPVKVENVILKHPDVEDVAVIGVPHEIWGEMIVACIVPTKERNTLEIHSDIEQFCRKELSESMRPDRYTWLVNLPRNRTGKVNKPILRERYS